MNYRVFCMPATCRNQRLNVNEHSYLAYRIGFGIPVLLTAAAEFLPRLQPANRINRCPLYPTAQTGR